MTLIHSKAALARVFRNNGQQHASMPNARDVLQAGFDTLDTSFDADGRTLWHYMRPADGLACFTLDLLNDMRAMHGALQTLSQQSAGTGERQLQYVVSASRIPGIYNLGGDLALFANKIRQRDRALMHRYAHTCIDVVHANSAAYGLPLVTIGLIQGDALGGGFECALSYDVIIAERSAKIGLPEILFNLFPGMGAYSFLSRRLGAAAAEKMILSGNIYTAEQLYEMGVVDVLAEDGDGEAATRIYIERNARKHNAHAAVYAARRRVHPVSEQELRDVVDIWVEAALNLDEPDLRKMERLAAAQSKRLRSVNAAQVSAAAE